MVERNDAALLTGECSMEKPVSLVAIVFLATVSGCAAWVTTGGTRRIASTVDYLYPAAEEPPRMAAGFTYLRPPIRVGIAFVPDAAPTESLPDVEKTRLLERIRAAFSTYPFVGGIEVIPVPYLGSGGGFTNLQQVARMFDVEVIALLSCDQVQFDAPDTLPVVYWTITGASVIRGAPHDTWTLVDASVLDVRSRKLLFRAPGASHTAGHASMARFSGLDRATRLEGCNRAVDRLVPRLHAELDMFRARMQAAAQTVLTGLSWAWVGFVLDLVGLILVLAGIIYVSRRAR